MGKYILKVDGTKVSEERGIDLVAGTNITLSTTYTEAGHEAATVTIAATGGGVTDHGALTGLTDDDHTQYILDSIADAAGDLLLATAADTWARLAIGAADTLLTSNGTTASWQAAGAASHPGFVAHSRWETD